MEANSQVNTAIIDDLRGIETLKSLRVECVGLPYSFRAGNWLTVKLDPLTKAGFVNMQEYIATDCSHTWKNNEHIVKLNLSQYSLDVGV